MRKYKLIDYVMTILQSTSSVPKKNTNDQLQTLIENKVQNGKIFGVSIELQKGDGSYSFSSSAGTLKKDDSYFIASTTKLMVTALIMKLKSEGQVNLDASLKESLPANILSSLHIYKGQDYSNTLTIRHLLNHTSGLADYFQQVSPDKASLMERITAGHDEAWSFDEAILLSKKIGAQFKPGTSSLYSDTNFQLLGKIIELKRNKNLAEIIKEEIADHLGLTKTYLYSDPRDQTPAKMYFGKNILEIPQAMVSFGADGGVVSTSGDMMIFLKAFFKGELFPASYLEEMKQFRKIFFPMQAGLGILKVKIPFIVDCIGHSGLSGAFAFYCPKKDVFMTGTVNQISYEDQSVRLMIDALKKL